MKTDRSLMSTGSFFNLSPKINGHSNPPTAYHLTVNCELIRQSHPHGEDRYFRHGQTSRAYHRIALITLHLEAKLGEGWTGKVEALKKSTNLKIQ